MNFNWGKIFYHTNTMPTPQEKIQEFADHHKNKKGELVAPGTKKNILSRLNKIVKDLEKPIEDFTETELWTHVENSNTVKSVQGKRDIQHNIKDYLIYHKLPSKLFEHNLVKNKLGIYINLDNLTEPV